jgi:hypothetical protein
MNLPAILAALLVFFPFQSLSNDSHPVVDHHQHLFSSATTAIGRAARSRAFRIVYGDFAE